MKLVDLSVKEFLNELSSKSPAPGGGSVAALSGANAVSLVMMVSSLTTKKKKFRALSEEIQNEYKKIIESFVSAKELFVQYIDDDTCAFNEVMAAFKLPKETESELDVRNSAIEKATIGCIKTPMEVAALALELLRKMELIIKHSNRNTTSDQGVAVLLLSAAFKGAAMNVKINLPGLSQKDLIKEYKDVIIDMTNEVNNLKEKLLEEVDYLLE
ncbi:cyclodeaminase/cyclohydrolase family protein [Mycoplasmatota bacterium WC30]